VDLSHPERAIVVRIDARIYEIFMRSAAPVSGLKMTSLIGDASYAGVMAALNRLLDAGILLMQRDGVSNMYRPNREHVLWPAIAAAVAAANGAMAELQKRISKLLREHLGAAVAHEVTLAVIGPVARHTGGPDSDLDLLGIFPLHLDPDAIEAYAVTLETRVRRWSGNGCTLKVLDTAQLNDMLTAGDPLLADWREGAVTFHGVDLEKRLAKMAREAAKATPSEA